MRLKLEQGKLIYIKPGKSDHMIKFGKANGQVYGLHTFTQSYVLNRGLPLSYFTGHSFAGRHLYPI